MASNLRAGAGEIDLLVALDGRVVAVEVKTRIGDDPMISVTAAKRRRLAATLARLHPRPQRLDVVAVRFEPDGVWVRWVRGV